MNYKDKFELTGRCNITIYNMDCNEFLEHCQPKEYDLAICDPPYFNGPNKLGYYGNVQSTTKVKRQSYNIIGIWDVPGDYYHDLLCKASKEQIIWGTNYYNFKNIGSGRIIWDKKNDSSTFSDGEIASCSTINTVRFFRFMWNGMLQENMKEKEIRIHPTQKPVKLYEWLLNNYAKEGQTILDTHLGSGSIAIACWNLGFDLTACELDCDYYKKACERLTNHTKQGRLFDV